MVRISFIAVLLLVCGMFIAGCKRAGTSKDTTRQTSSQVDSAKESTRTSAGVPRGNQGYDSSTNH